MMCLQVLRCWLLLPCLSLGVSLLRVSPDLHFWSDTSAVGWGAHLDCQVASGLWDPPTDSVVYQRRGTARYSAGAFPVPVSSPRSYSGCLLRHHHSGDFPSQGGWHLVSSPQHLGSGDLALEGVPLHPPGSTVPSGLRQRPSRRPVSPSPAPTSRMVFTHDRLSVFEKTVAGSNSFLCNLSHSSLFDLLLPFPGSEVSRHGRVSPVLGRPSGLRVPSGGCHSAYSREAPGLHGDGTHSCGSPLGSAPLVF